MASDEEMRECSAASKDRRPGARVAAAALALALFWTISTVPAAQDVSVGQVAERLFAEEDDIQFELPELPKWDGQWKIDLGPVGPLGQTVMLMVAAVALVLLAFWLAELIQGFGRPVHDRSETTGHREIGITQHDEAMDTLARADLLARDGRFAEAVHLLLVHGLAVMREVRQGGLAASLTSREILRVSGLSESSHAALEQLVGRVEPIHFGGRPATQVDYRTCRVLFDDFAESLRTQA